MTDLSPAERADRAREADALAEATLTLEQRGELADVLTNLRAGRDGHRQALTYYRRWSEVEADALAPVVARMIAEAADAREAEVRARVAQAIEAHPARWLNADGTTSPILPATTASAAPPEPNNVPSQAYLKALVAAEQDRLRAEGWRACVDHIRRVYASWLMPEDTYWVGRHNPYAASEAPDRHDLSEAVET